MKCPSKEIDKNNISLLLPNHNFSTVSLKSQHLLSFCLLVVPWCFCSLWRSDVFVLEKVGWLRRTPVCPLLCSQAERLHGQSLPLRHWALTCTHSSNPLLPTCSAALLWGRPLGTRFYSPNKTTTAGSSFLVFPSKLSYCRFTLKIHMTHHGSVELV